MTEKVKLVDDKKELIKKTKAVFSQREIEQKTKELCEMIEKFEDEGRSSLACWICTAVATYGGDSDYEMIGILHAAITNFEESIKCINCENFNKCQE